MTRIGDDGTRESRILAVDLGARRIGLAVDDPLGLTAQGLTSLERRRDVVAQILEVCREWNVGVVVVGLPLNMNGTCGPAALAAQEFAGALAAAQSELDVVTWDERLSSAAAERALIEAGVGRNRRRRGGLVDRGAATLFLQAYLGREKNRATPSSDPGREVL
jgi:putative Holliday junction resolvase